MGATDRAALLLLQAGGVAVVLAALPQQLFQLDRYTIPKELVLQVAGFGGALCCLARSRRLTLFLVDWLLLAYLAVSLLSALLAVNGWLAARAVAVSAAGAALFWTARSLARAGRSRPLLLALAAAVVLGALTGLAQTYGLVTTSLASLSRAPGGTFGNRNFMAHLVAIGLPLLLYLAAEARSRRGFGVAAAGAGLAVAALVLSRSRAAWVATVITVVFLAAEGLRTEGLWNDVRLRRRGLLIGALAGAAVVLVLLLPNRLNWRSESPYLDSLTGVANYKEGSGRGRLIQYGNTIRMAGDHPLLGVGPGNWPVHYPRYMSPGDPSFDADDVIPTNPWPSSDWMALVAERGVPALLLLALAGGSVALAAWGRARAGTRRPRPLADLTVAATLIGVAVVGAFDAVLLLPAPTFFAWTIVGALGTTARPVREIVLTPTARRRLLIAGGVVGALLLVRSATQIGAMVAVDPGRRETMERAARLDPGSYRIHMLLAESWRAARRCARARPHAEAAAELFPHHPAPAALLRACGNRPR